MKDRRNLADDLERVLAGSMSLVDVLAPEVRELYGESLIDCFSDLHHFLADDDIRKRDPWYNEMLESEMRKLISLLRSGAEPARLRKVTFLDYSDD